MEARTIFSSFHSHLLQSTSNVRKNTSNQIKLYNCILMDFFVPQKSFFFKSWVTIGSDVIEKWKCFSKPKNCQLEFSTRTKLKFLIQNVHQAPGWPEEGRGEMPIEDKFIVRAHNGSHFTIICNNIWEHLLSLGSRHKSRRLSHNC